MLESKHHEAVKEIYKRNAKPGKIKGFCKECFNRRFTGIDSLNRVVVCGKCVDVGAAKTEWEEYAKANDIELKSTN